jgi:hypothetical protein
MAVKNLEVLVLRNVSVLAKLENGVERIGTQAALCGPSAPLSSMRTSPTYPRSEQVPDSRQHQRVSLDDVGTRAGRLGSRLGVLSSRIAASCLGWPARTGPTTPANTVCTTTWPLATRFTKRLTRGRPESFANPPCKPNGKRGGNPAKRTITQLRAMVPGTSLASTWRERTW